MRSRLALTGAAITAIILLPLFTWWYSIQPDNDSEPRVSVPSGDPTDGSSVMSDQWIDPIEEAPGRTTFHLYQQPTRSHASKGSYLIQLPPSYDEQPERRFPLVIWLHDAANHQRQGAVAFDYYWDLMSAGKMPEVILCAPQALPVGWYINSMNRQFKITTIMLDDLLLHLDREYRTIADRHGRALEGFSMGGYGSLYLGFRHPDLFGAISAISPSLLPSLDDFPEERTKEFFDGKADFWHANHPLNLAKVNAAEVKDLGTAIRVMWGGNDERLTGCIKDYVRLLQQLEIPHQEWEIEGLEHDALGVIKGVPEDDLAGFWTEAFATALNGTE